MPDRIYFCGTVSSFLMEIISFNYIPVFFIIRPLINYYKHYTVKWSTVAHVYTNRSFATNGHMVQIRHAGGQVHYHSRTRTLTQRPVKLDWLKCGNNNELVLQHGGFCTMWSFVAKGLLIFFFYFSSVTWHSKHVIMQNTGLLVVVLICLSTTFTSEFMMRQFEGGPLNTFNIPTTKRFDSGKAIIH